jgi:hypothetical protein
MRSVLRIGYDPKSEFCKLDYSYSKRFVSFVSTGIRPSSYRKFDPSTKCWSVHVSRIPLIVSFGKRCFDHVDYRALPESVQIKVVRIVKESRNLGDTQVLGTPSPAGPHAVLFVLETAPWEVIAAAYKALALKCHPDHGGNVEDFLRIQKAYEELKSKHNS